MFPLFLFVSLAFPAALSLIVHTVNWKKLVGRPLHRLESYTLGAGLITLLPTLVTLYARSHMPLGAVHAAALYCAAAAGAGLAIYGAWGVDALAEKVHQLKDGTDRAETENRDHARAHRTRPQSRSE